MSDNNNNEYFSWWQTVLIIVIFLVFAIPVVFCATNFKVTVGPPPATPAPTVTPDPYYIILVEQAKASAKVQVITAETDNEIKLRWNIHYMRRFWAYFAIPVIFIFAGLGLYIWGLRYGRE